MRLGSGSSIPVKCPRGQGVARQRLRTIPLSRISTLLTRKGDSRSGRFQLMRGGTNVERLRQGAKDITEYTERTLRLFRKIYAEQELEHEETQRCGN
jgi:hypothetical protein